MSPHAAVPLDQTRPPPQQLGNARTGHPAWQERYRRRAGVEGTLSQGVRAFGMRGSRYIGLAKTAFQHVCIAVGMNVSRVVHWLDGMRCRRGECWKWLTALPAR